MYEELVFQKLWLVLPLWLILYIADYTLTIIGARYYKSGAQEHFLFEGSYELSPEFQNDIDALRTFSPTFIKAIMTSSLLIVFLWYFSFTNFLALFFFKFLVGGIIIREFVPLFMHVHNITLFHFAYKNQGVSGQVQYKQWLSYRMASLKMITYSFFFLFVYFLSGSISFLGGAVLTASTGLKFSRLSMTHKEKDSQLINTIESEVVQEGSAEKPL